MNMRTALVTGATGFVGGNLIRFLLNDGWIVFALIRKSSSLSLLKEKFPTLNFIQDDGATENLIKEFSQLKIDVVFHLASYYTYAHKTDEIQAIIESNVVFGTRILEAMAKIRIDKFINVSSVFQHYENKEYSPVNLYAATKKAFEVILQYYTEAHRIDSITLELTDTYGELDTRAKLIPVLLASIPSQKKIELAPGEQEVDFLHIEDVCRAFLVAAKRLLEGYEKGFKKYSLSNGQPITLKELVRLLESSLGFALNIAWGARSYRVREPMHMYTKGEKIPGWKIQISYEQGFERLKKSLS